MSIQKQVEEELFRHLKLQVDRVKGETSKLNVELDDDEIFAIFAAEFLTGASQVLRWLIVNDGSSNLTPQIIERACVEVGREFGLAPQN